MDFMNLNQAAHGDREFGYVQTRLGVARKTVAGHVVRPGGRRPDRRVGPGRARLARVRSLKLARFGDNMRDVAVTEGDKVEAQLRFGVVGQHLRRQRPRRRRRRGRRRRGRRAGRRVRGHLRRRAGAAPRRRPARVAALRRPDRARPARVPRRRRVRRLHHQLRGPRRAAPAARPRRPAADGRRLRVRRRGRLEDRGAAAHAQGRWPTACPAAPRSWRTTPTTWRRATSGSSARTCSRSARRSPARPRRRCEIHPLSIGDREDPVRLVFDAAPGAGVVRRHRRHRRPVPAGRQRDRRRRAGRAAAQAARRVCGVGAAARPAHLGRGVADGRRAAPHRALHGDRPRGARRLRRRWRAPSSSSSTHTTTTARVRHTSCAGTRPTTDSPRGSDPCDQSQQQQQPRGCGLDEGEHHGFTFTSLTSRPTTHDGGDDGSRRRPQPNGLLTGAGSPAAGRCRQLPGDTGVELRLHQPRHDEPVLRPDAVRHRGRLGAARHDVPVDRVRRPRTSPRWSTPSRRRSPARPTASPWRSSISRRSTTRSKQALDAGIPVVSYNADAPERPDGLRRAGPVRVGRGDGRAHRRARRRGQGGVVHRHARAS